ncbi:MAG: hypothetical protein CTY14_02085 [Methylotenera sp.]|nr:MAG: hypothetical protein CTY14_02085 [Methylotenera sp.]
MQLDGTVASEEANDLESQQTAQEVAQAEESAAFSASLNGDVRADEAPAEQENTEEAEVIDASEATLSESDAVDDKPIEQQVGLTPEQLTAMLAKMPKIEEIEQMTSAEIRKIHGKFGELNRALLELQKNGQTQQQAKVNFNGASFKRMQAEFPEIAEILAEDFNNFGTADNTQSNEVIESRVAQVREELSKDMQKSLLLIQHKDAPQLLVSDDYKVWKQTLPDEERVKLDDSWDAMYIGEKLTEYKNWNAAKNSGTQERRDRLQRAITPRSTQVTLKPQAMTELDGFNMAFKR